MSLDLVDPPPLDPQLLREYILDMLDQLASLSAEHQDLPTAKALWSCWGKVSRMSSPGPDARPLWEGSTTGEVVPLWADAPSHRRRS